MGRLFTFGCSFTQYMWPTWANIVAYDLQKELYNFAWSGIGNVAIMNRVMEADLKFKFTPEDKIMIMWSSWSRDDAVIKGMWSQHGSRWNHDVNIKKLRTQWAPEDDIVKNATAIQYVTKCYKDNILWQGHGFVPWQGEWGGTNPQDFLKFFHTKDSGPIKHFYKDRIVDLPYRIMEVSGKKAFDIVIDSHPDVLGHLEIVNEFIYPAIGYELKKQTQEDFQNLHNQIKETLWSKKIKSLQDTMHIVDGILLRDFPEIRNYMDVRLLTEDISG